MLIGFLEACLNTEKACGPTKNVKAYASSLLYNYLEHNGLFNQYVTYEQKGIELLRGNYKITTNHEFDSLSRQLIEDIAPFLLDKTQTSKNNDTRITHWRICNQQCWISA